MPTEPKYVCQNGEAMTDEQCRAWIVQAIQEARTEGCTWNRVTHDQQTGTMLVEAWLERPEDEGEPRFAFLSVTP